MKFFHKKSPDNPCKNLSEHDILDPTIEDPLVRELSLLSKEIRITNQYNKFGRRLIGGIMQGFGAFLGATVVVSILLYILKTFATIDMLKPFVNNIIKMVQQKSKPHEEPKPKVIYEKDPEEYSSN